MLQGQVVLSLNDKPEVREIFAAFEQQAVEVNWPLGQASSGKPLRAGELIITG